MKVPWHIRRYIYQVNKALVDVLFWTLFFHFQQSSGRKSFFELLKREVRERVKRGIKKDWKKEQPEERLREPFLRWVLLYLFYYKCEVLVQTGSNLQPIVTLFQLKIGYYPVKKIISILFKKNGSILPWLKCQDQMSCLNQTGNQTLLGCNFLYFIYSSIFFIQIFLL